MYINDVSTVSKMEQLNSAQAPTSKGNSVSIHGDGIVESKDVDFSQNPFNKYTADDFDRFNTLLSGRNGAEAKETTDVITNNVNNLYNDFKRKYPDAKLEFPEPPNPEDFPKGKKGYHAYEKALLQWENSCLNIIKNEETRLQNEQSNNTSGEPEPIPPKDDKQQPKTDEPPKEKIQNPPKEKIENPPKENESSPPLGKYTPKPGELVLEEVPPSERKTPEPSLDQRYKYDIYQVFVTPDDPCHDELINNLFKNKKL